MHLATAPRSLSRGDPPLGGWSLLRAVYLAVSTAALALGGTSVPAASQEEGAWQAGTLSFDIPAQPLDEALFAYTRATGLGVLIEDGLASGRRSAAVKGRFTPQGALSLLLIGTGLEFRYTVADAFTLAPAQAAMIMPPRWPAPPASDESEQAYFRTVQTAVRRALCSRAQTLPGQYRVAVQLWIGSSGAVVQSAFLGSTGSRDRDADLAAMLNGLAVGGRPPPGLPQPVTLVILPRSPEVTRDCAPSDDTAPERAKG